MKKFKIIPLTTSVAEKIRTTMQDDHGHSLIAKTINGRGLCRLCLADGAPPQQHILFSYMPVQEDKNPYTEVGPVYIHDQCEQYRDVYALPPAMSSRKYLTVRGYDEGQFMVGGKMAEGERLEDAIDTLFNNPSIEYIHVSDASTGCYFFKVVRA